MVALSLFFGSLLGCTVPDTDYCGTNDDCPRIVGVSDASYVCHPTRHVCIPFDPSSCFNDTDCKDLTLPHCNLSNNRCEACVLDSTSDTSCKHNAQTPYCGTAPGGGTQCVACRNHLECPSSTPICDSQRCRKCQKHSDCEGMLNCDGDRMCTDSLVCISDADFGPDLAGQCAMNGPNGHVIYAYNDPAKATCNDLDGRPGTDISQPFCDLEAATEAAKAQMRLYVRAIGGGMNYQQTTMVMTSEHMVFIGAPGLGVTTPATVEARGTTFEASANANVTIDTWNMLEIGRDTTIAKCTGTPPSQTPLFTVRNSLITGSTLMADASASAAVDLQNCQAKVSGNVIGLASLTDVMNMNAPSHSRGLRINSDSANYTGASFLIENNIIAGNWSMAVDLDGVTRKTVTFQFNTIVYNGRNTSTFGGIRCPSTTLATLPLENSILYANGAATASQFAMPTACTFNQLVVGTGEPLTTSGLIRQNPTLDGQFYLLKGSVGVDQAQLSSNEIAPAADIVGTKRPQGSANDIGAFELPQ